MMGSPTCLVAAPFLARTSSLAYRRPSEREMKTTRAFPFAVIVAVHVPTDHPFNRPMYSDEDRPKTVVAVSDVWMLEADAVMMVRLVLFAQEPGWSQMLPAVLIGV